MREKKRRRRSRRRRPSTITNKTSLSLSTFLLHSPVLFYHLYILFASTTASADFTAMPPPPPSPHRHAALLPPLLAAAAALTFFFISFILYRKITRKRTVPTDLMKPPFPPQSFTYSLLRRCTDSFSAANRLGQGGFGAVYKGILPSGQEIAVKLMSEASIQGEREFQNELSLASRIDTVCCPYVVCVLGFSTPDAGKGCRFIHYGWRRRRKERKLLLVYEYMQNGSLQDALLDRKCAELMNWSRRFSIIVSIAKGLDYLHFSCDPPVIHGDIKPSNILLDSNFDAKIADFGLAQALSKEEDSIEITEEEEEKNQKKGDDYGSIIEETESFVTEDAVVLNVEQSPDSYCVRIDDGDAAAAASPSDRLDKEGSISEGILDRISVQSCQRKGLAGVSKSDTAGDWWWKQENMAGLSDSGRVKDYVMEWIGSEINKERPKKDWMRSKSSVDESKSEPMKQGKKKKKLEWWGSLDRNITMKDKKNRKKPREWWKEEFCDELDKKSKKKKKRSHKSDTAGEMWWQRDDDGAPEKKRRWSIDGFSGEFRIGRRNSQDWANSDIPKSGAISSTPSMRGTVCYIAPEYGGGGQVSDKCDVYSFGVLVLVMVSGRRPLQVMASPMSEFERANLISWARQLALNGRLLELVDSNIQLLNKEEALLCITIALLCLQRAPNKRPSMKEIVEMLSGKSEPPHLPFEFSPSPPSSFYKSRKKAR